jgi:hypothetical protein
MIEGAIIGAIAAAVAVFAVALFQPRRKCPDCGTPLPKFRAPSSGSEAVKGGWTCRQCGCKVDRKGNKIAVT